MEDVMTRREVIDGLTSMARVFHDDIARQWERDVVIAAMDLLLADQATLERPDCPNCGQPRHDEVPYCAPPAPSCRTLRPGWVEEEHPEHFPAPPATEPVPDYCTGDSDSESCGCPACLRRRPVGSCVHGVVRGQCAECDGGSSSEMPATE